MARLTNEEQLALVARARLNDAEAIALLYRDIAPMVRRAVYRMVAQDDLDDMVQETMMKAFSRLDQYAEDAAFSTWVVAIAKNSALMLRRKEKRRAEIIVDSIDKTQPTAGGQQRAAIDVGYEDRQAEQNLAHATVHRAIRELDSRQQIALVVTLDGGSSEDVALALGVSLSAAKSILHRGRQALAEMIRPELKRPKRQRKKEMVAA